MEREALTDKQKEVLKTIKRYIKENRISPTIRELCKILDIKSTATIQQHLERLKDKGYITYIYHSGRSIAIVK